MARLLKIVYVKYDPSNKYANSDSESAEIIKGSLRVIDHTQVTIYTSTKNVVNAAAKLCSEDINIEVVTAQSKFMSAVKRRIECMKLSQG